MVFVVLFNGAAVKFPIATWKCGDGKWLHGTAPLLYRRSSAPIQLDFSSHQLSAITRSLNLAFHESQRSIRKFLCRRMSSSKKKETTPQSSTKKKKHKHKHTASYVPPSLEKPSPSSKTKLFQKSRLKIHVAVPPAAATTSLETFLHHHLTSNILLKHTDNGTIVAFSNFQAIASTALIRDECPFAWSWFEGDIVLFNPRIGQRIRMFRISKTDLRLME